MEATLNQDYQKRKKKIPSKGRREESVGCACGEG